MTTRFFVEGSALAGTVEGRPLAFEVEVALDSPAPPREIERLLLTAERSCYVLQSLLRPVEVSRSYILNGEPLE